MIIRPGAAGDAGAIDALQNAAFGSAAGIPALVHDLRAQPGTMSLVADRDGVAGHVMLSHAWLDGPTRLIDVLVLSPLGVHPSAQGQGIGTALLQAALVAAAETGAPLVFLEGDPGFYGTRGFEHAGGLGFRRPSKRIPERAFQVARLDNWSPDMTGTLVYRDVHWRHGVGLYR